MHSVFQRFATREVDVWVQHRLSELPNLTEGRNLCPSVWMLSAYLKNRSPDLLHTRQVCCWGSRQAQWQIQEQFGHMTHSLLIDFELTANTSPCSSGGTAPADLPSLPIFPVDSCFAFFISQFSSMSPDVWRFCTSFCPLSHRNQFLALLSVHAALLLHLVPLSEQETDWEERRDWIFKQISDALSILVERLTNTGQAL